MDQTTQILIVDDTEINRDTLESLVEALGYNPMVAAGGAEAMQLLRMKPHPDLVLLDILMPEVSGYDVLQFIKQNEDLRSIPVIIISVVDEMESIVQCIEQGADDYLTKPFNALLLRARINSCLLKKRHLDQEKKFNLWLADSYQKLQRAEQVRDELFHMIVHDMNNQLTTILGETSIVSIEAERASFPPELLKSLDKIKTSSRQLMSLVKSIMEVSRLETDQMPVHSARLDLVQLLHRIRNQYDAELQARNVAIDFDLPQSQISCHADESLLTRVLQNIMTNCLKYGLSAEKPRLRFIIDEREDQIICSIADNGPGIPENHLKNVFTKFFQVDAKSRGLGLGLTSCKLAMEAMGGEITAANNHDGGAVFHLTLKKI